MNNTLLGCFLLSQFSLFAQIPSTGITAVYENGTQQITIKWQHNNSAVVGYIIQKSENEVNWKELEKINLLSSLKYQFISFTDKNAFTGKNFYRLKLLFSNGAIGFSRVTTAIVGSSRNNWIMYPVPVKDVLNLQYNGTQLIQGIIGITIERSNGMVFHRLRYASSSRLIQIPVGNLGRGLYYISMHINQQLVWKKAFSK